MKTSPSNLGEQAGHPPVKKRAPSIIGRWDMGVIFLIVALLLAACGGKDEPTPTPTPTAPAATPATPESQSAPVSPLPVPVPASPLSMSVSVAAITPTTGLTATTSASQTVYVPIVSRPECEQQPDLDVAGYPHLTEKMGCPLAPANFDPVAINEFGPGPDFNRFMLWFSNENQIYVLLPDQHWEVFKDTWTEDQPTFSCNPLGITPASPPLPRRGFGKIWCTVEGLQEIMGTVTVEERLCQHSVVQRFEQGRLLACYEDATIRYLVLFNNSTWDGELTR